MPTYTNPKWVHVEPRGRFPIGAVIILVVIGYVTWQVADWVASVIAVIVAAAAIVTLGAVGALVAVLVRQRGRAHLDAPQWVVERLGAPRIQSQAAVPAVARKAIEPPRVVRGVVLWSSDGEKVK